VYEKLLKADYWEVDDLISEGFIIGLSAIEAFFLETCQAR
jgi:hypothetical protein